MLDILNLETDSSTFGPAFGPYLRLDIQPSLILLSHYCAEKFLPNIVPGVTRQTDVDWCK